jgi:hypothetical protein
MNKLAPDDLMTLEAYARERADFRVRTMAHKQPRRVALGDHVTLMFEDRQTIQYQVQEMLRIERIFEREAIQDELDAYNPLIPEGRNLKATMLVEFPDPEVRKRELVRLRGIEHRIYLHVDGHEDVMSIADEDMERSNDEKTSAVHFLRFELTATMIEDWRNGARVTLGCRLPEYPVEVMLDASQHDALSADFD